MKKASAFSCMFLCIALIAFSAHHLWFFVRFFSHYVGMIENPLFEQDVKNFFSNFLFYILSLSVSTILFIQTLCSLNTHHAARLTYEEYKERAKQKKLEKTRKKMQELEEKLQKESTE